MLYNSLTVYISVFLVCSQICAAITTGRFENISPPQKGTPKMNVPEDVGKLESSCIASGNVIEQFGRYRKWVVSQNIKSRIITM